MTIVNAEIAATKQTYVVSTGNIANVAAARTTQFDLFNASTKTITVIGLYIIPALTAVTGIGLTWEVLRTTAVGTGGSALTPQLFDTSNTAVPSTVTARSVPTGGATGSTASLFLNSSSEETSPYAGIASTLNHIPAGFPGSQQQGIVLRNGQGLKVDQTTNSNVGTTNIVAVFTIE